jgi:hypothetical protein
MLVTNKLLSYGAARRELACSKRASDSSLRHSFLLGYCQVGRDRRLWHGLGHEHDIQSLPRLPLSA